MKLYLVLVTAVLGSLSTQSFAEHGCPNGSLRCGPPAGYQQCSDGSYRERCGPPADTSNLSRCSDGSLRERCGPPSTSNPRPFYLVDRLSAQEQRFGVSAQFYVLDRLSALERAAGITNPRFYVEDRIADIENR